MFKRLQNNFNLDFLDNKIAEEQEKQKQTQPKPGSSSPAKRPAGSGTRRPSSRTDSPVKRPGSRLRVPEGRDGSPQVKGPDPDDFVIGDDESGASISRTGTPQPVNEEGDAGDEKKTDTTVEEKQDGASGASEAKGKEKAAAPAADNDDELPEHVRRKLATLEKLTAKYQDLLRNYRTAHARVSTIDPFEATLREYTSLDSINDPGALIEYLNQRNLQKEMVMEELKRVTGEKNDVDTEGMLDECQLLDPDKEREKQNDIICIHLETLLLLTTTKEGRAKLREVQVYPIIRELHLHVEDESVREACDRLVQVLKRGEEGDPDPAQEAAAAAAAEQNGVGRIQEVGDDEDEQIVDVL